MIGKFEQLEPNDLVYLSSESLMIRVKPYLAGLCARPDQRVRTPSLLAHITCQRACVDVLAAVTGTAFADSPQY